MRGHWIHPEDWSTDEDPEVVYDSDPETKTPDEKGAEMFFLLVMLGGLIIGFLSIAEWRC